MEVIVIKFGRVSKETKGVPGQVNWYEDQRCLALGNIYFKPPGSCPA